MGKFNQFPVWKGFNLQNMYVWKREDKPFDENELLPMKNTIQPSRRFCCDACRMAWWKAHSAKLNRKAIYCFTCPICTKPFTAYGNANRKYCSRKCYGKSKAVAK